MTEKRDVPALLDQPIKIFIFDKEDGIVALTFIFVLTVFMDNLLMILIISFAAMMVVNRLKANKPRGYIIHLFYRYYNFVNTLPKYVGRRKRIRP